MKHLGDLVHKIADFDHLDWTGRVKLINCICDFVLLSPPIGQVIFTCTFISFAVQSGCMKLILASRINGVVGNASW